MKWIAKYLPDHGICIVTSKTLDDEGNPVITIESSVYKVLHSFNSIDDAGLKIIIAYMKKV